MEPSSNIELIGDGTVNSGIVGTQSFVLKFTGLTEDDTLHFFCSRMARPMSLRFDLDESNVEAFLR